MFALALGGPLGDTVDHAETSEADSRAADRADPADATGDCRTAGERISAHSEARIVQFDKIEESLKRAQ